MDRGGYKETGRPEYTEGIRESRAGTTIHSLFLIDRLHPTTIFITPIYNKLCKQENVLLVYSRSKKTRNLNGELTILARRSSKYLGYD